jgi:hypothetical protein
LRGRKAVVLLGRLANCKMELSCNPPVEEEVFVLSLASFSTSTAILWELVAIITGIRSSPDVAGVSGLFFLLPFLFFLDLIEEEVFSIKDAVKSFSTLLRLSDRCLLRLGDGDVVFANAAPP